MGFSRGADLPDGIEHRSSGFNPDVSGKHRQ